MEKDRGEQSNSYRTSLAQYDTILRPVLHEGIAVYLSKRRSPTWVVLACGNGKQMQEVAKNPACKDVQIVGVDLSENVLQIKDYQIYSDSIRFNGISFSAQDLGGGEEIVLPSDSDLITMIRADKYFKDILPVIFAATNSLATDGIFIMSVAVSHTVKKREIALGEERKEINLSYYLRGVLEESGGSLKVYKVEDIVSVERIVGSSISGDQGEGRILFDQPCKIWVIRRGSMDICFDYELNDLQRTLGGGYTQEYLVD